jgi:hypothetical protein
MGKSPGAIIADIDKADEWWISLLSAVVTSTVVNSGQQWSLQLWALYTVMPSAKRFKWNLRARTHRLAD